MNSKNIKSILFLVLVTVAVVMGVVLVQQNQETRRGAYFANTAVQLKPDSLTGRVGEVMPVQVWVVTENEAKMDGFQGYVCFESGLDLATEDPVDSVIPNEDGGFSQVILAELTDDSGQTCLKFAITSAVSADAADLSSGAFEVATINFKPSEAGTGTISLVKEKTKASGVNTTTDKAIAVTSVSGADYSIAAGSGGSNTGDGVWASYKIAFAGVRKGMECASGWQVKLTAMSGSSKKEYSNINLTKTDQTNSDGEVIYQGSMKLSGFTQTNNVALFFKGPKHLQVKYGQQNQAGSYNQAGGQLSLATTESGGTVYDFSKYPLLAGDTNGDGIIDGEDFTMVKNKAKTFEHVSAGGYLKEDLDGSCQVNNSDIILLVRSLNEKQDQVY